MHEELHLWSIALAAVARYVMMFIIHYPVMHISVAYHFKPVFNFTFKLKLFLCLLYVDCLSACSNISNVIQCSLHCAFFSRLQFQIVFWLAKVC